jgi:membrane-associated phospholipid phosphatase
MAARAHQAAPLIPDFLWRWIGWLVGLLAAVVTGFAVVTNGQLQPGAVERQLLDDVHAVGLPEHLVDFGLALGSPAFFAVVVVALAVWAMARRSWPALIACATVPGAVVIVEQILKPLVDRRYVWVAGELYYPSGTAAGVAAWTTLTWLLAVPLIRQPRMKVILAVALGLLTALTAVSVVSAEKHFPFDAIGGVAAGMGVVLACAALIDLVTGAHRSIAATARAPVP